ncbi:hypothetical protein KDAU_34630 [Dictyobacter aurantiacus]|uniref:Uncharacterized protein n=1 Tax=Dictyobacter aurantiacus TaxID=1936993 RepID=A0A401ZGW5_9CHLR|nr:hypothetical protein KDAU_34630 [Dictyobacter aurantiacus]
MVWFGILTGFALVLDFFSIFEMIVWIDLVIRGIKRAHAHQQYRRHMHALYRYGIISLVLPIMSVYPLIMAYDSAPHADISLMVATLYGVLTFYSLTIILWGCVIYLRVRVTREVFYCYLLPEDANKVRIRKFLEGMKFASKMLPQRSLKREVIDPLVRSMEVAVRLDVFPKGKKEEVQLTNDFHIYCKVPSKRDTLIRKSKEHRVTDALAHSARVNNCRRPREDVAYCKN